MTERAYGLCLGAIFGVMGAPIPWGICYAIMEWLK